MSSVGSKPVTGYVAVFRVEPSTIIIINDYCSPLSSYLYTHKWVYLFTITRKASLFFCRAWQLIQRLTASPCSENKTLGNVWFQMWHWYCLNPQSPSKDEGSWGKMRQKDFKNQRERLYIKQSLLTMAAWLYTGTHTNWGCYTKSAKSKS